MRCYLRTTDKVDNENVLDFHRRGMISLIYTDFSECYAVFALKVLLVARFIIVYLLYISDRFYQSVNSQGI